MRIVLYSEDSTNSHEDLDEYLEDLFEEMSNPSLSYIPSSSQGSEGYFEQVKDYYSSLGVKKFIFFSADQPYSLTDLEEVLESSAIYLSGGNAFYFLQNIKKSGLDKHLIKYSQKNGIVIGVNAGANILTPTIVTATIPHDKLDKNEVRLTDLKGLELTNFEFAPHYDGSEEFKSELINYSTQTDRKIFAVPDGSGTAVENGDLEFIGQVTRFYKGQITQLD